MLPHPISRLALASVVALCALPALVQAGALTDLLIAKVGVTQPQADGGAGSIFKLARAQMTPENFQKLRSAVPGMDTYLGAAPAFLPGEQPVANAATMPANGLAQTAALAGAGSKAGKLAAIAGSGSTSSAVAAAGGGSTTGALAASALGGGSSTGALAAAALGQPVSPTEALKGAARNKTAESVGGTMPSAQGGLAGVAAGALAGNAGGVSTGSAVSALLAGTALGDKLQAAQALTPAFQQLGMKQGAVAQFLPIVVGYVKSVGGKSSSKLLTHALGL